MPEYTPEEELLLGYMALGLPDGLHKFRELRLHGWTDGDDRQITSDSRSTWWNYVSGYEVSGSSFGLSDYWKAAAVLTFFLRRPISDYYDSANYWWRGHKDNLKSYTYYDGDAAYSHALYLDPSGEISDEGVILRYSGKINSQGEGMVPSSLELEVAKPRQIPQFPQWDEKIIERFHRSTDPEMQEYKKAIGDWSALLHNTLSQLA